jgi:PEP-CTERM motif-containing protein
MKKFIGCLGILVLILGFGGMARATLVTFDFDPVALPDGSGGAAIGTYMTVLYGSPVSVTGQNGPVSETTFRGFDTLLGSSGDGYIESESLSGDHLIQINFTAPITSVSFDYGQIADEFHADYLIGSTWTTDFFSTGWAFWNTGHVTTITFSTPVSGLRFHDDGLGEVGIDNLVVNRCETDPPMGVPEPATLLFLGLGLLGVVSIRKFKKL